VAKQVEVVKILVNLVMSLQVLPEGRIAHRPLAGIVSAPSPSFIPPKRIRLGLSKTIVDLWSRRCTGRAMTNDRTILITGVTGNQGGAVAEALQAARFHLRGLTRKPDSERAAALARQRRRALAVRLSRQAAQMKPIALQGLCDRATLFACHSSDENRSIIFHN